MEGGGGFTLKDEEKDATTYVFTEGPVPKGDDDTAELVLQFGEQVENPKSLTVTSFIIAFDIQGATKIEVIGEGRVTFAEV